MSVTNEQLRELTNAVRGIALLCEHESTRNRANILREAADALDAIAAENAKLTAAGKDFDAPEIREFLGQMVRAEWVQFASEQPNPKPSHLLPWEQLDEANKEVDRRIGVAVANFAAAHNAMRIEQLEAENAKLRGEVEKMRNYRGYLAGIMRRYLQWDSNKSPYTREYCLNKVWTHIRAIEAEESRSQTPNGGEHIADAGKMVGGEVGNG